jgi:tetratricopeptide (TPR) repeat protein
MNSLGNKIFGDGASLTPEELDAYAQGNLSNEELHALEQKMASDPMNAEAAEGFAAHPGALAALGGMQSQFNAQLAQAPKASFWATNKVNMLVAASLVVGGVILFSVSNNKTPTPAPLANINTTEQTEVEVDDNNVAGFIAVVELTDAEVESAIPIAEADQITYDVIIENQPETVEGNPVPEDDPIADPIAAADPNVVAPDPIFVPSDPVDPMTEIIEAPVPVIVEKVIHSNMVIAYIVNLKVVDYSAFYATKIEISKFGKAYSDEFLEAKYETHTRRSEDMADPDIITTYIPYTDYLEAAMKKFNLNKYSKALKDYRTILKFFPKDVNAHFYAGLCCFNIGKMTKAVEHFDRVMNSEINTFHEEAKWYKTLVYLKRGFDDKAKVLLEEIIIEDGFYAKRAEEKLRKMQ